MIREIIEITAGDNIFFTFKDIGEIREGDEYSGYRVALSANYPPMVVPLKLDITTGDRITPHEVQYNYKLMLEDRSSSVLAYNLVTILAEKLECVISRGDQNTRMRDYYDIYILTKLQSENIDWETLAVALQATSEKRSSSLLIQGYGKTIDEVKNSEVMNQQWNNYRKDFFYAADITFVETCDAVIHAMENINKYSFK